MDKFSNLFELFANFISNTDNRSLIGSIEQGGVNLLSASNYKAKIESVSLALINIGIKKKTKFGIYLPNSTHWHIIDLSIMVTGAISVPFYRDLTIQEFCQQLTYTECEGVFVENLDIFADYYELFQKTKLKFIVTLDEGNIKNIPLQIQHIKYSDLILLGQSLAKSDLPALQTRASQIGPEDIATIVATSGSTEGQKFVMISHRAVINVLQNLESTFMTALSKNDRTLVIMPLSHMIGRINSLMHLVFYNETIFCSNLYNLHNQLKAASPTIIIGFPKILKMLYYTMRKIFFMNKSIFAKNILNWSSLSADLYFSKIDNELSPTSFEIVKQNMAQKIIFKKIIEFLGGKLRIVISVGGHLSTEVYKLLRNCNIIVLEGYGLTETTGLCIINPPYKQIAGTIGLPIKNNLVTLSAEGEIVLKSNSLFSGYYKHSDDGSGDRSSLKTGDIGEVTPQGFLKFIDRKKNFLTTADNRKIYPHKIEAFLEEERYISHALVTIEQTQILAVIGVDPVRIAMLFARHHEKCPEDFADMVNHQITRQEILSNIKNANQKLGRSEKITLYLISPFEFTLPNQLLTPTYRIIRAPILERITPFLAEASKVPN